MGHFEGKLAIVTGAASGIGRAIAHELARRGCGLVLVDRDSAGLERVRGEIGGDVCSFSLVDLGDAEALDGFVREFSREHGALDILVNNAGTLWYDPFEAMPFAEWERLLDVNLHAPARLIHGLLPSLRRRPGAHIVNISSVLGLIPKRKLAAYCTSKFGLVGFSLALRAELSPAIGVSVVCPGLIRSNLYSTARAEGRSTSTRERPSGPSAPPELVAKHVVRAIRKNRRLVVVTGHARVAHAAHTCAGPLLDVLQMRRNRGRQSVAPSTGA